MTARGVSGSRRIVRRPDLCVVDPLLVARGIRDPRLEARLMVEDGRGERDAGTHQARNDEGERDTAPWPQQRGRADECQGSAGCQEVERPGGAARPPLQLVDAREERRLVAVADVYAEIGTRAVKSTSAATASQLTRRHDERRCAPRAKAGARSGVSAIK